MKRQFISAVLSYYKSINYLTRSFSAFHQVTTRFRRHFRQRVIGRSSSSPSNGRSAVPTIFPTSVLWNSKSSIKLLLPTTGSASKRKYSRVKNESQGVRSCSWDAKYIQNMSFDWLE